MVRQKGLEPPTLGTGRRKKPLRRKAGGEIDNTFDNSGYIAVLI